MTVVLLYNKSLPLGAESARYKREAAVLSYTKLQATV